MVANLATASVKSAGGSQTRALGTRFDDVVNVRDFAGVTGNINDIQTPGIQAALEYAFGPWNDPHGDPESQLNRCVYFPAGNYKVRPSIGPLTITGVANVGGAIQLTVASTAGLASGDMVYVRKVTGTTNANGSLRIVVNSGTTLTLYDAIGGRAFNGAWTGGGTVCPPALRISSVHGARIYGDGKAASNILCDVSGCAALSTNGFQYSHIHDLSIIGTDGIGFDLNMVGGGATTATQSDVFTNCRFGGGDYGCAIGMGQHMGSEMTFVGCYIGTGYIAGISWHNFNALAGTVIGGNFACNSADAGKPPGEGIGSGILVVAGACPVIQGVSFQLYDGIDIDIRNGASDAYSITGCRSETENFVRGPAVLDLALHIAGCCMTSPAAPGTGFFYSGGCKVELTSCVDAGGHYIEGQNASIIISNSTFPNATYLSDGPNENYRYLEIHPVPVKEITATAYTIMSYDGGHKLQFNNASPQTITLAKNSDGTNRLFTGSRIEVQRTGAGEVSFAGAPGVTIRSEGSKLRLNAQYSCGVLACDGSDLWTFSGDRKT